MKNVQKAKELFKGNLGDVVKVFGLNFLVAFVIALITSLIPIISMIGTLVSLLYTTVSTAYLYNKMIICNEPFVFSEMLKDPYDIIFANFKDILFVFLIYWACSIPAGIIMGIDILVCMFLLFLAIEVESISSLIVGGIIAFVILLLVIYYMNHISYRLRYKIACILAKIDYKSVVEKHKKDINKMSIRMILLSLIPFVGWVILIILPAVYNLKIILDVEDERDGIIQADISEENVFEA